MNREIKFRAWEKHRKEMIAVSRINFETKMINIEAAWRLFNEVELMQYTGLKDKNGNEIYESDVIRYSVDGRTETLDVFFDCGGFKTKISSLNAVHLICEVVGNKYEGMKN